VDVNGSSQSDGGREAAHQDHGPGRTDLVYALRACPRTALNGQRPLPAANLELES
jgi:hypothetical protein